ncbi:SagB/ThcOx family dehydrogenase [Bhargavaea ullalensis]|uniref:SagB-type dehydrogenase family enzyme n=1 Tax=Bhargavaea ullalensis TaxID=1265685 RepID=A0ABV2G7C7_9BACL
MKLWDFSGGYEQLFQDYHYTTINDPAFTSMQVYKHSERTPPPVEGAVVYPLAYEPDPANGLERALMSRHSWPFPFPNERVIDLPFISRFTQLAFIGSDRAGRTYPSGGARYEVKIHLLFNPSRVVGGALGRFNVCEVDADRACLAGKASVPWERIEEACIQKESVGSAQFAVVLTADLEAISEKYSDISYKLIQQEAGHIGQNVQLVANYLGIRSLPLGGFYDLPLGEIIGTGDAVLYTLLLG